MIQTNLFTKQEQTYIEQTYGPWREGWQERTFHILIIERAQ